MLLLLTYLSILRLVFVISQDVSQNAYNQTRQTIVEQEVKDSIGGNIILNEAEQAANKILMKHKLKEMDEAFENPTAFPPARSFSSCKKDIEKSKVFKLLKHFPKGAALHMHSTCLVSADFVVKNLTHEYEQNLYVKISDNKLQGLGFYNKAPNKEWEELRTVRRNADKNKSDFDEWMISQLSLGESDTGADINKVWKKFESLFALTRNFVTYEPVWKAYIYRALQEFHDDNINYIEFRGSLPKVYKLDNTTLTKSQVCQMYIDIVKDFKKKNPTFFGAKLIYSLGRHINIESLRNTLKTVLELKKEFPCFIAGFDLVGQEDLGGSLKHFSGEFLKYKGKLNYFFHAGETNWNGFTPDYNLLDAILIGTKRIGHGYALTKHPEVAALAKKRGVGIEICPISNQVLGLVHDLRNHPAAEMFINNYPVVITPDDPGFWGAKAVSYDWYQAFMGFAAKWQDLRLLKQLALNSIEFSALKNKQKKKYRARWDKYWDAFIKEVNKGMYI